MTWKIDQPFVPYTLEMLESVALRALPAPATKILHVFERELVAGGYNGKLRVPQSLILEWMNAGNKAAVSLPVRQLHRLGFIRPGAGPRLVRLTFFATGNTPPTNEWRQVETFEQADELLVDRSDNKSRPQSDEYKSRLGTGDWPKRR